MKVLPLVGYRSLQALHAFNALLLGLKMLPAYITLSYEEYFASFQNKSDAEKETLVREAAAFVQLQPDEVEALASFVEDKNGVPYGSANIKNLGPVELHEIIVAVSMEIGRLPIRLVTETEKKN